MPSESDLLNNFDNGAAIMIAVNFSNLTGMLSGPVDLFTSNEFKILRTSFSDVVIFFKVGTGKDPGLFIAGFEHFVYVSV